MSIEDAARAEHERRLTEALKRHAHTPWWMRSRWDGRFYRLFMRISHRFGFCYPVPVFPEDDVVWWCTWCGLRGKK